MKKYRAFIYLTNDIIELEYYSNFRNKSQKNYNDIMHAIYKRYDKTIIRSIEKIEFGYIIK